MASLSSFFSSIWAPISLAFRSLMPLTCVSSSGSSSITRNVSSPNFFTILAAREAPTPFMAPDPRYRSMPALSLGATTRQLSILNWLPYTGCLTYSP